MNLMETKFSQELYTDATIPPWRKFELTFSAKRLCRVDAILPWADFRLESPKTLPVTLRPDETLRMRLANETGIAHTGGATIVGVEVDNATTY